MFTSKIRLDLMQIGDDPTAVELCYPDGSLMAIVFGSNTAHLIAHLLNEHAEWAVAPENTGEDK